MLLLLIVPHLKVLLHCLKVLVSGYKVFPVSISFAGTFRKTLLEQFVRCLSHSTTMTMRVFYVYLVFIGVLSHAQDSSEENIDISYMSNVLCNNHPECVSCLSKMSITCDDKYGLENVRSVFDKCYKTYRKKMNPLTKLCDLGKKFGETVTFEFILRQFPHFNQNCQQDNQLKFLKILQENMADHLRQGPSTFLCLVTLTEGILSTTPYSVPPQDFSFCKGFLPISERGLEIDEKSSGSSEESLESNNTLQVGRMGHIYIGKDNTGHIGSGNRIIINGVEYKQPSRNQKPKPEWGLESDKESSESSEESLESNNTLQVGRVGHIYIGKENTGHIGSANRIVINGVEYKQPSRNQKPKRESKKPKPGSKMPKPVSDGSQPGYEGPQSGYPEPKSGYPGPKSGYSGPQSGYPGPQYGYPGPQYGYPGPQSGYPGPQSGYPGPQSWYQGPQSGYPGPQSGYPGHQPGHGGPQPMYGGPQPAFPGVQPGYPSYPSISGEKGCSSKLFMASVFAYLDDFFYKQRSG